MLDASTVFYMDKIVADDRGHGVISLEQSIGDNIRELAKKKGKPVGEMVVAVLDRPRHAGLIEDIRAAGAGTRILLDGDVAGGINAAQARDPDRPLRRHRRQPGGGRHGLRDQGASARSSRAGWRRRTTQERARGEAAGLKFDTVLSADDLVSGDNTMFIATGVTDGGLVDGVRLLGDHIRTESVVLRSKSGTFRRIVSEHVADRWL